MMIQQYRQAVQEIRWTPQQRAAMMEKLRMPQEPAHASGGIQKDENARFFKAITTQTEDTEMKIRRSVRMMWLGLAAALLATGGAVAAVVGYAKRHPHLLETTLRNGITLRLTDEESEDVFTFHTTNNLNAAGFDSLVVPNGTGWFFRKSTIAEAVPEDKLDRSRTYVVFLDYNACSTLYYADQETGEAVPVCARPNCMHDGNIFCPATTGTYALAPVCWHDGYLYALTTKYRNPEKHEHPTSVNNGEVPAEECSQVLVRIAPDGTEITELADFGQGEGTSRCIFHRGYIWCIVQRKQQGEEIENPISHRKAVFESGGWQLWGYELSTGRSAIIFDGMGDPSINHINDAPDHLFGAGDYLYFCRGMDDWSGGQGLSRISLLTGEVTSTEEEIMITGNHLAALSKTHAVRTETRTDGAETVTDYYLMNLETGEEIRLFDSLETHAFSESEREKNDDTMSVRMMDENYIYAETYSNYYTEQYRREKEFRIYDYDGKLVKTVQTGLMNEFDAEDYKDEKTGNYMHLRYNDYYEMVSVDHGILYILHTVGGDSELLKKHKAERNNEILYCSVDDLLNGKTEWKQAYSLNEEVRGNAN